MNAALILMRSSVVVDRILYSKTTGTETWLTSDGRAYLVQLYEYSEDDIYSVDTDQESMNVSSVHYAIRSCLSESETPLERA